MGHAGSRSHKEVIRYTDTTTTPQASYRSTCQPGLRTETQALFVSFENMKTVCYTPDFNVNMTRTDGVTYSTIGPSITTSPPEQPNSRSGGVEALPVTSMGPGDSSPQPGAILALPRSQSPSVVQEEIEDPSRFLFEGQGAGCRHG